MATINRVTRDEARSILRRVNDLSVQLQGFVRLPDVPGDLEQRVIEVEAELRHLAGALDRAMEERCS